MTKEIRNIVDGDPVETPVMAAESQYDPEEFMSKRQLAERLKVTPRTIENWMRCGVVPYIKIRKVVLFQWFDVVEHMRRNFRVCRKS